MKVEQTRDKAFEHKQKTEFDRVFQEAYLLDNRAAHIEFNALLDFMGDLRGKRVLDLGCGIGRASIRLAPHAGEVVGYDISEVAVAKANENAQRMGISNFRAEVNNFSDVEPESFDVILCVNMLHHTHDPEAVLRSIHKALRPDGCLVILENNPVNPLFPFYFLLIGQVRAHLTRQYLMVNRFGLARLLASAGLRITAMRRHGLLPTMLYNYSLAFKSLNEFLNRIPVVRELAAFHFIKAQKSQAVQAAAAPRRRPAISYSRAAARVALAVFPFLYAMREFLTGRVFAASARYANNLLRYRKAEASVRSGFPVRLRNVYPRLLDRYQNAGTLPKHYFWQDLWGARKVYGLKVKRHYDIGSRLDGFIAHCLPFCEVVMLDIRPLPVPTPIPNLSFEQANCMDMKQIPDGSIESLSTFHAIEHFGLGRYGDPIDPLGHRKAIAEMKRIVREGGSILLSVPLGEPRVEFDAHRVFDPLDIIGLFDGFDMVEFSVIDDADAYHEDARPEEWRSMVYGCGLFHFRKRTRQAA